MTAASSRRSTTSCATGGALPRAPNHAAPYSEVVPTLDVGTIGRYGPSPVARYDLTAGRVDPRLFPADDWRRCVLHALRAGADAVGRYGDPAGSPALRRSVTHWIAQTRGIATTPDRVVVTQGTGQKATSWGECWCVRGTSLRSRSRATRP